MTAGWAGALVAIAVMAGTFAGILWRGGRRDGKIDAVLEELAKISVDHETRLRAVEHPPSPQHRRGGR
jgi:hypothetical protein